MHYLFDEINGLDGPGINAENAEDGAYYVWYCLQCAKQIREPLCIGFPHTPINLQHITFIILNDNIDMVQILDGIHAGPRLYLIRIQAYGDRPFIVEGAAEHQQRIVHLSNNWNEDNGSAIRYAQNFPTLPLTFSVQPSLLLHKSVLASLTSK